MKEAIGIFCLIIGICIFLTLTFTLMSDFVLLYRIAEFLSNISWYYYTMLAGILIIISKMLIGD